MISYLEEVQCCAWPDRCSGSLYQIDRLNFAVVWLQKGIEQGWFPHIGATKYIHITYNIHSTGFKSGDTWQTGDRRGGKVIIYPSFIN